MSHTLLKTPSGFSKLSKADQVKYVQRLWNLISEKSDEIPVPESHIRLIEQRLLHYRANSSTSRPAFEVIERLTKKHD